MATLGYASVTVRVRNTDELLFRMVRVDGGFDFVAPNGEVERITFEHAYSIYRVFRMNVKLYSVQVV